MMKKSLFILAVASIFLVTAFSSFRKDEPRQQALKTVIIDAGHGIRSNGGYDGAKGSYSYEDEICLDIAKELLPLLKKEFPEIKFVETRPGKNITSLHDRANIANRNNGDLFLSIHVNAAPPIKERKFVGYRNVTSYVGKGSKRRKVTKKVPQYRTYSKPNPAKGTETYIWGAHKTEDKEIAIRENAPMLAEDNFKSTYGDIDPNSPEFISFSLLKTKQFFTRSATLASFVEDEFIKVGRTSRGEKQRQVGIWVLQATAMPSVLVETGFITNKEDEDYLNSEAGQKEIAGCIVNAVKSYVAWVEKQQQHVSSDISSTTGRDASEFLEKLDRHEKSLMAR